MIIDSQFQLEGMAAYGFLLVIAAIFCALLGLLVLPALIVAGIARRQAERVRNERVATVIAQYEPPRGLSPAQAGLLYDMRCGRVEIMATLFDLEQRKIVRLIDNRSVEIIDKKAYEHLAEYEKIAIRIARGATDELDTPRTLPITISNPHEGSSREFHLSLPQPKSLRAFSRAVAQSMINKGIPIRSFAAAFIVRVAIITVLLCLAPLLLAALPGETAAVGGHSYGAWSGESFMIALVMTVVGLFFTPVYIGTAALLTWLWTKIAGRYWINTKQARAMWPELEGYKLYLKQVDLDNIQFESTNRSGAPVTRTLPYAMVFGLDTDWQERLKNDKQRDN